MLYIDQGTMWAATRYFFLNEDNHLDEATIFASMNQNELIPLLRLKSSYDNSYPGIVLVRRWLDNNYVLF